MEDAVLVKNLTKKFGKFTAVDDISFSVPQGSIFAFLGPNGAGKTTTIKILTTLLDKTSGSASVCGHDVAHHKKVVRKSFGICFQDQSLDDDLTAFENMDFHGALYGLSKSVRRKKMDELLALVDLSDRKKDLVRNYSGGMKRRLELARSLLHEPKILFLDEPTLGLDPQTRNHIWDYIKKLSSDHGMTIFFTTHYMEEASRMADHIAIIDHGRIIENGTPDDLIARSGAENLEDAFLKLTGESIRDDGAGALDGLRQGMRVWAGKK